MWGDDSFSSRQYETKNDLGCAFYVLGFGLLIFMVFIALEVRREKQEDQSANVSVVSNGLRDAISSIEELGSVVRQEAPDGTLTISGELGPERHFAFFDFTVCDKGRDGVWDIFKIEDSACPTMYWFVGRSELRGKYRNYRKVLDDAWTRLQTAKEK